MPCLYSDPIANGVLLLMHLAGWLTGWLAVIQGLHDSCAHRTRPARTMLQQDPSAHVYWESLIVEAKRPQPRTGAAFICLGGVCLTPGLVMH